MNQSINIPWSQGMNYGMGINLLNGQIAGKAVDPGPVMPPVGAPGQTVSYNLRRVNTIQDMYESIGISVDVNARIGLFSASGKFRYSKEVKFNTQSTFLVARCVVENAFMQCEDARIRTGTGEAAELLASGQTELFHARYGDGFVRGMQTGGEFFAIYAITSSTREEQETISASLQAQYGGIFASVDFEASLDASTKSRLSRSELQISTYQRGGQGDEQSFTKDVQGIMKRLGSFPKAVLERPVPYEVQIAHYNTLSLPAGPNTGDIQEQKESLDEYAKMHLKYETLQNDIEFLQRRPEYFTDAPNIETTNEWQTFISERINTLTRQASRCVSQPKDGCPDIPFTFPKAYRMPERKLHSSREVIIYELSQFEGASQILLEGSEYDDANGEITIGNDTLSSIMVPEGIVVRLYEHFHFQGKFIDIRIDTPEIALVWNNRTSSIRVSKSDSPIPLTKEVIVFEHDGLGGVFQILSIGRYDGVNQPLQVGNGFSSALIPKGMVLRLYDQPNFGGEQIEFREDMTMANHLEWNDRSASVIVYEDGKEISA